MNQIDVLVFGSAIIDFITYVLRFPKIGETIHGNKFVTGFGGKGANQCVAAARLGAKTAIIAKLGDDIWGKQYKEHLDKENINNEHVEIIKNATTGIAQINVSQNGDNQIIIVTGANDMLCEEDVNKADILIQNAKILLCQLETPINATKYALERFKGISILNTAPALENIPIELLKLSTILCLNETEASLMTKTDVHDIKSAKNACIALIEMGANTVILTLGNLGVIYSDKNERKMIHISTPIVLDVVDTTGAGDAFIGSLGFYLAKFPKLPMYKIIGAACYVASETVRFMGTQSSFPSKDDISFDIHTENIIWSYL